MKKLHAKNNHSLRIAVAVTLLSALCIVFGLLLTPTANAYAATEIHYGEGSLISTTTETIDFYRAEITEAAINSSFPAYYNTNIALQNTCANVAGAIICGYYDRYFDLIPDFTVGRLRGDKYTYTTMQAGKAPVQNLINTLYMDMNTNTTGAGATKAQYDNGLKNYVARMGKSTSYSSVMANNALDMEKVKSAVNDDNPVSLFLSGYNISELMIEANKNTIKKSTYSGDHIMIAYGYKIIKYYNASNQNFRTDTVLMVSTTDDTMPTGYYVVGTAGKLNDAEAVNIY